MANPSLRSNGINISSLYGNRFRGDLEKRNRIWKVLCGKFFQKFVPNSNHATVVDLGAGFGEFINNIKASSKIAVDLNDETPNHLNEDVTFIKASAFDLKAIMNDAVDIVFVSNLLEHMHTKNRVLKTLQETNRVLKPGGLIMILGPNIKYAYREYWDFFDHYVPLSHNSLDEALSLTGFKTTKVIPRFLPYSTKTNLLQNPMVVKLYLKMPIFWNFFGKQMFVLAQKER